MFVLAHLVLSETSGTYNNDNDNRENGKGGMRKGAIGQVNRNTQQTNTNRLDFPIPPFLIPPFPISQLVADARACANGEVLCFNLPNTDSNTLYKEYFKHG